MPKSKLKFKKPSSSCWLDYQSISKNKFVSWDGGSVCMQYLSVDVQKSHSPCQFSWYLGMKFSPSYTQNFNLFTSSWQY
jgi:hypothetical protein